MLRLGYFGEIIQKDNLQKSLSSFFKFIPEFEEGSSIESYIQSCDVLFFSDCEKYFDQLIRSVKNIKGIFIYNLHVLSYDKTALLNSILEEADVKLNYFSPTRFHPLSEYSSLKTPQNQRHLSLIRTIHPENDDINEIVFNEIDHVLKLIGRKIRRKHSNSIINKHGELTTLNIRLEFDTQCTATFLFTRVYAYSSHKIDVYSPSGLHQLNYQNNIFSFTDSFNQKIECHTLSNAITPTETLCYQLIDFYKSISNEKQNHTIMNDVLEMKELNETFFNQPLY